ncbi:DUF418 domain-containing protein [Novosphingobium pituita]|uniref:DUF418 domain-containing protein n=1 Tax=Novosphingobium pituita TaxID=3056842 RepID=A0ABQ6P6X1_9SPHN|nr:DUF418 domain-containing protein [Novosphingobium sp. IK01]GMM60999.1 DUF418 domain-containing protein [Novosphingobium sp. IK01]
MTSPSANPPRIAALDFLRGCAVLGILAINITGFWGPQLASLSPALPAPADPAGTRWFLAGFVLFEGKMRALFTLLFGASMMLFAQSAQRRGLAPDRLQVRRLLWLAVFGYAHYALLWWGDILFAYALCGLVALPLRRLEPRGLLAIGVPVFVLSRLFDGLAALPEILAEQHVRAGIASPAEQAAMADLAARIGQSMASDAGPLHAGFFEAVALRLTQAPAFPLTATLNTFAETFPLMLIGMALFQSGFFTGQWRARAMTAVALGGTVAGGVVSALLIAWPAREGWPVRLTFTVVTALAALPGLAMALGYAAILLRLHPLLARTRIGAALTACGRTAFTNYLGTSLVMTALFGGWKPGGWTTGLGWGGVHAVPRGGLPLFVVLGWALMLAWPRRWLAAHGQGPLEALWRRLTFGTGPLPHPASHKVLSLGGRVGERAGAEPSETTVSDQTLRPPRDDAG